MYQLKQRCSTYKTARYHHTSAGTPIHSYTYNTTPTSIRHSATTYYTNSQSHKHCTTHYNNQSINSSTSTTSTNSTTDTRTTATISTTYHWTNHTTIPTKTTLWFIQPYFHAFSCWFRLPHQCRVPRPTPNRLGFRFPIKILRARTMIRDSLLHNVPLPLLPFFSFFFLFPCRASKAHNGPFPTICLIFCGVVET